MEAPRTPRERLAYGVGYTTALYAKTGSTKEQNLAYRMLANIKDVWCEPQDVAWIETGVNDAKNTP